VPSGWESTLGEFSDELGLKASGGRIAEFGCSGGESNSIKPVQSIVPHTPNGKVYEAILEEFPSNPWHQVTSITDAHRDVLPHVRFLYAGQGGHPFMRGLFAPQSLWRTWRTRTSQSTSFAPPLVDHLIHHESKDVETQRAWSKQAADDWERLLTLRAEALKPGGKLLLSTMGRCDNDSYAWKIFSDAVWEAMQRCSPKVSVSLFFSVKTKKDGRGKTSSALSTPQGRRLTLLSLHRFCLTKS
jgi:hypothetical protein